MHRRQAVSLPLSDPLDSSRGANRQTQPREHRPHPRSRSAPDSPPDRVPLARQNVPRILPEPSSDIDVVAIVGKRPAAPGSPRPRTAPAAAVPRAPLPSPRGNPPRSSTSIANSPRPPRSTTRVVQASLRAAIAAGQPPAGRPRRNLASRRRPGPGPRDPHCIFRVDNAVKFSAAACSTPPCDSDSDSTPGTGTVGAGGGCSAVTPPPGAASRGHDPDGELLGAVPLARGQKILSSRAAGKPLAPEGRGTSYAEPLPNSTCTLQEVNV